MNVACDKSFGSLRMAMEVEKIDLDHVIDHWSVALKLGCSNYLIKIHEVLQTGDHDLRSQQRDRLT